MRISLFDLLFYHQLQAHPSPKRCQSHNFAETGLYASGVETGEVMRQPLDQGLTSFHGLCTYLPSLDVYGLKASIWKRSLQLSWS
jgi:hypothetical protein